MDIPFGTVSHFSHKNDVEKHFVRLFVTIHLPHMIYITFQIFAVNFIN